jgi:lysylphosphatidylglycerol synthetase-like protein (DUF2156 family)
MSIPVRAADVPHAASSLDRDPIEAQDRSWIDHPSGHLALAAGNQRLRVPGVPGFAAYRPYGKHLVAFGGVHAPPQERGRLLDALIDHARQQRRRVLAIQVRADQVPLFGERGFTVNRFGSSYGVGLARYSFAGTPKMKLRNKIKRARTYLEVLEVGRDLPRTRQTYDELTAISGAWLTAKGKKEIEFMIGELGTPEQVERRIFVARDRSGRLAGFVTYVPVWGARPGYLHDLSRRDPNAPVGVMEIINATALERFRDEQIPYLHFGFTPFIAHGAEPPAAGRILSKAIDLLARYGSAIYPAQTQVSYKLKWGPDLVDTEYIAGRPLGPRAVLDLLRLTRSL